MCASSAGWRRSHRLQEKLYELNKMPIDAAVGLLKALFQQVTKSVNALLEDKKEGAEAAKPAAA